MVVSFLGEAFSCQPFSTIGIIISPILTFVGMFFWVKFYKRNRGYYPNIGNIWSNISNRAGTFYIDSEYLANHFLEFITSWVLILMISVLASVLIFKQSDSFKATKKYCESEKYILAKTGKIKYYGVLVSGSIVVESKANFSFTIVGMNGNFRANSKVIKNNGEWIVESVELQ